MPHLLLQFRPWPLTAPIMSFQRITIMGTTTHIAGMVTTTDTTGMAIIMAIDTIDMDITTIGNGNGRDGFDEWVAIVRQ